MAEATSSGAPSRSKRGRTIVAPRPSQWSSRSRTARSRRWGARSDGAPAMIVRMWHGRVPTAKADAYRAFTNGRAIPDYRSVPGNVSVHILERREGEVTHFITLTFWESLDAIRQFAGADVEKAKYYPEDDEFLLEFEPRVVHYEVVGKS